MRLSPSYLLSPDVSLRETMAHMSTHDQALDLETEHEEAEVDSPLLTALGQISRYVALLAACLAMGGSLFFSEVLGWIPCTLCWYQRILMYPLTVLLAVSIIRRDNGFHWYILPFSLVGASVSLYHYLLIKPTGSRRRPVALGCPAPWITSTSLASSTSPFSR